MTQDFKCMLGHHKYKVLSEHDLKNPYGTIIGTVIISRCDNCGKIKSSTIYTDNNYRQ